jgi:diguanylate cyclase (GGDEF)-like protein
MIGLCYLDLDRFKLVNASFGREFGDMLLMQVAERLTSALGDQGIMARMEGDEFALLFPNMESESELLESARSLLHAIDEPFELKGFPLHITASLGAVTSMIQEDDGHMLLKKADIALVKVKESGKNDCMMYSESWSNSSFERLTLQHEMYRAIQRCEFILHYQPQYDLVSGMMVGVEALVRWRHPVKGMIAPGEFIPIAEESGMIIQIGDWVLEEACRQNKAWQDAGLPPMPVSVNLSIRQFVQQDLSSKVASVLEKTGLKPEYLDLEITESMTMDTGHVSRCLLELTDMGVGISVDDFGTGYSSFHYLKNFPIDRLKIDRSFVRDIQQDPSDAEIVAAIIAMAHNLNIQVIAEGVENEEQMEFLRKHRCDEMQGYFWSPPVSSAAIEQMLGAAFIQ